MQLDIIEVTTSLTQHAKVEHSLAIIGAISDIIRHLRKSIHCSLDDANLGADIIKWNRSFREAVDKCLVQLSDKVRFSRLDITLYLISCPKELRGVSPHVKK